MSVSVQSPRVINRSGEIKASPPSLSTKGYIREFDGLRGFAILAVLLNHFWPTTGPLAPYLTLSYFGWVGVDLFFVLSGFLITGILLDTRDSPGYYKNFYARRMLRIFPLYYLFLAVVFLPVLLHVGPFEHSQIAVEAGNPLWYLLYLGNFHIGLFQRHATMLDSLWSLSIEEQFYLVFPFLVARCDERTLRKILLGMLLVAPLVRLGMAATAPGAWRLAYVLTPARIDTIAFGALLALELRLHPERWRRFPTGPALGVLIGVVALTYRWTAFNLANPFCEVLGYTLIGLTFFLLVSRVVTHRNRPATRLLRLKPLCYLGKISYGVYLLQSCDDLFFKVAVKKIPLLMSASPTAMLFLRSGLAIGLAVVSWHAFEKPILGLKSRFVSPRHPEYVAGTIANLPDHKAELLATGV